MSRILNFGSLNIDYVYDVDHFVRPGETLSSNSLNFYCGGKGLNQSVALARASACCYHAGAVGSEDGGFLVEVLQKNGVDVQFIAQKECRTGHAIIQVDRTGQNSILLFGGANQKITEEEIDRALEPFHSEDMLLLQNEINSIGSIMEKAAQKGMKILLNPSPMNLSIQKLPLHLVSLLIVNEIEAAELCNGDETKLFRKWGNLYPKTAIVLTLGEKGVLYFNPVEGKPYYHGVYEVPVVDTTAAGDTFTGYFIAMIAQNNPVEKALELASIASAIAISRKGAEKSIPFLNEVSASQLISAKTCLDMKEDILKRHFSWME
ncbi:MAG: ribokinase [Eubacteriales bacterium]